MNAIGKFSAEKSAEWDARTASHPISVARRLNDVAILAAQAEEAARQAARAAALARWRGLGF